MTPHRLSCSSLTKDLRIPIIISILCASSAMNLEAQTFGDGAHVVGRDIRPGTYRAPGGEFCTWERVSGFGGTMSETIAVGVPVGPTIVTIASSDAGFKSQGCGLWRPLSSAIESPATPTSSELGLSGKWVAIIGPNKLKITLHENGTARSGAWRYLDSPIDQHYPVLIIWLVAAEGDLGLFTFGVHWVTDGHGCLLRPFRVPLDATDCNEYITPM